MPAMMSARPDQESSHSARAAAPDVVPHEHGGERGAQAAAAGVESQLDGHVSMARFT
jgi:hypothetical protein